MIWPAVVLVAIAAAAWLGWHALQRIPVAPEPMRQLAELRAATQKALDLAGAAVVRIDAAVTKLEEEHRRLVTRLGGKGELVIEKPARSGGPNFPGPG